MSRKQSAARSHHSAFTLIELSIVLVIIGLIIGGVLVGQNLIAAAGVRAQITQIEKYNTSANDFYGKYGYLPGDITKQAAAQFGFVARGNTPGEGDGNGLIESGGLGYTPGGPNANQSGEITTFWVDLSTAGLIDGSFNTATPRNYSAQTGITINLYLPQPKIGGSGYLCVTNGNGLNYFDIATFSSIGTSTSSGWNALTVQQAYAIDQKIDDGLPQTGRVTAQANMPGWFGWIAGDSGPSDITTATPPSATSCYDDGGNTGTQRVYSIKQNGGQGVNCPLAFQFQ